MTDPVPAVAVPFPGRGFAAFLFDMDGTILTSIASAERVWAAWAQRHGLDVAAFLPTIHGVRSVDTIRRLALPGVDPVAEAEAITRAEMVDTDGIDAIAGAAAFLGALPPGRWGVVTSAPRRLAERRLGAAGLPVPPLLVAAEDIRNGKPAPDWLPARRRTARRRGGGVPGVRGRRGRHRCRRSGRRRGRRHHRDAPAPAPDPASEHPRLHGPRRTGQPGRRVLELSAAD